MEEWSETLPCPPGESPFHAKGHFFQNFIAYYGAVVPGGIQRVWDELPAGPLRRFAEQPFSPLKWYDMLPAMPMIAAAGRALGLPPEQAVRERSSWQSQRDIRGVFKLLLMVASPELVSHRLPQLFLRYFDFGKAAALEVQTGRSRSRQYGLPRILVPWYRPIVEGYCTAILRQTGAKEPAVGWETVERDGERQGIETVTVTWSARWT